MMNWPLQSQAQEFYGNPQGRNGGPSKLWEVRNLTTIIPPFAMHYSGSPIAHFKIHHKCAASLARILNAIWTTADKKQSVIDRWGVSAFGGSYNFRLMRNSNAISMHAFGCAIDLAPERFPMGQSERLFCPEVCQAFTDEGWVNLPRDRMHFQAALI